MENSSNALSYWSRSDSSHLLPDAGLRSQIDACGRNHFDYVSVSNLGHVAGNSPIAEQVSRVGWSLAILGFLGVLMILRPGGGLDSVGVVLALLNAGLAAVFHLITRVLTKTESNISLLFHATLFGEVCFGLAAIPSSESSLPNWGDLGLMVLLGLISTSGHFLFTVAYQYAPASLIAPANYMHLVWAALLS